LNFLSLHFSISLIKSYFWLVFFTRDRFRPSFCLCTAFRCFSVYFFAAFYALFRIFRCFLLKIQMISNLLYYFLSKN
jgi:hypothetical protein